MRKIVSILLFLACTCALWASSNGGVRHLQPKRVPVILMNYADVTFKSTDYDAYKASLEKYFADNSFGQYTPTFEFIGPVTIEGQRSDYGANDEEGEDVAAEEMVAQACNKAENLADFTQYDQDGDGRIDALIVIYAGEGERMDNNMPNAVWEFTDDLETTYALDYYVELDGKRVAACCAVPELQALRMFGFRSNSLTSMYATESCTLDSVNSILNFLSIVSAPLLKLLQGTFLGEHLHRLVQCEFFVLYPILQDRGYLLGSGYGGHCGCSDRPAFVLHFTGSQLGVAVPGHGRSVDRLAVIHHLSEQLIVGYRASLHDICIQDRYGYSDTDGHGYSVTCDVQSPDPLGIHSSHIAYQCKCSCTCDGHSIHFGNVGLVLRTRPCDVSFSSSEEDLGPHTYGLQMRVVEQRRKLSSRTV